MERSRITPHALLVLLWGYVFSVLLGKRFWGAVFDKLIRAFDLSPNQAWILPVAANLIVAAVAVLPLVKYLLLVRKGAALSARQHVTWWLCIAAFCLCLKGAIGIALSRPKQLASAVGEFVGGKAERVFAAGTLRDGSYSNAVVGVSLRFPDGWYPMSLNAINRAKSSGAQAAFGEGTKEAQVMAAAKQGIYALLAVHKYPEPHTGYNPSLAVNAYEKQSVAATGIPNLEAYANSFAAVRSPYQAREGPIRQTLGASSCYYVHIEGQFPQATIQQHVYVTETDTLYLVLVASVMNDSDLLALKQAVATLHIEQK